MNVFIVALLFVLVLGAPFSSIPTLAQGACNEEDVQKNYSLYAEDFKNKSYKSALPYLKWMLKCAPSFGTRTDRNFRRLVVVYEGIAIAEDDPELRRTYLDSALTVYDTAPADIKKAGIELDTFKWTFNKGYFIQSHPEDLADVQHLVGPIYLEAYHLDPLRMEPYFVNYIINDLVERGEYEEALRFMDDVETKDIDMADELEAWRNKLITNPEDRIAFLEKQLEKKPDGIEVMEELIELYNELGMRDEAVVMAKSILEKKPDAPLYRLLGSMRLEDGFEDEAIEYFLQSLVLDNKPEASKFVYYQIAVAHQQVGRYAEARDYYQRALAITPDYGEALIALGNLVSAIVLECGTGTLDRKDKAVYWLAADYFDRAVAHASSPELRRQAQKYRSQIEPYFPTIEEKFYMHWETGNPYVIDYGCYAWVNDTTTIR